MIRSKRIIAVLVALGTGLTALPVRAQSTSAADVQRLDSAARLYRAFTGDWKASWIENYTW